jgi:hypothetical protein
MEVNVGEKKNNENLKGTIHSTDYVRSETTGECGMFKIFGLDSVKLKDYALDGALWRTRFGKRLWTSRKTDCGMTMDNLHPINLISVSLSNLSATFTLSEYTVYCSKHSCQTAQSGCFRGTGSAVKEFLSNVKEFSFVTLSEAMKFRF